MEHPQLAVDRIQVQQHPGMIKAFVSLKVADSFIIKNIRVLEGKHGLFVAMPAEKYQDQNQEPRYSAIAFPINRQVHDQVQRVVLAAYERAKKGQAPAK